MSEEVKAVVRVSDAGAAVTTIPGARARSETTTLLFAVAVAVALGVACGIWINSRMASSAEAARRAASSRVPPDARAETPPSPPVETRTLQNTAETAQAAPFKSEAATVKTEPTVAAVEAHALKQPAPAATPAAAEATPQPKPRARLVASFVSRESSEGEQQG